ncbi:MAG TPA: hypothetical protein DDX98_04000 [Bacteroidales bacterium]|nr:hypothetical protein [Bacteroidales bacterium]
MKTKHIISLFALFATALFVQAQIQTPGQPESDKLVQLKSAQVAAKELKKLDIERYLAEDKELGISNRYAILEDIDIDIIDEGTVMPASDGNIWQYSLKAENAKSLAIHFSEYNLPAGAKLFLYNADKSIIRGAYTSRNNKPWGALALADFPGGELVIEYYEPFNAPFNGKLKVGSVGKAYRDLEVLLKSGEDIDITCEEANLYQTEKHAVAKMTFSDGSGSYLCTGALINNTREDGTPYFLTANHCLSTEEVANTLVTHFNYEVLNCSGSVNPAQTISGSTLLSTGQDTDFTLLELSETPPNDYKPYYAGWNAVDDEAVSGGYGIHHPGGRVKKFAISYDSIYSFPNTISWEGNTTTPPNTHWLVQYNLGFTEGGSSGSPVFDMDDRIIGQLHGGSENNDFYGKLSQSWDTEANADQQLKVHLDPDNTGLKVLDGYYPDGIVPDANFYTDLTEVCSGEPIQFYDASAFDVDNYLWTFSPSSVSFSDGTDETSMSPVVSFLDNTDYTVALQVQNVYGSDIQQKTGYIKNGNSISPKIMALGDTASCLVNQETIRLVATGAVSYEWNLLAGNDYIDYITSSTNDSIVITLKEDAGITSGFTATLQLKGYHGTCADSVLQNIEYKFSENDNIEDAIELSIGKNGPFTNECASAQENEPFPTIGSCETPGEWCDCTGAETLIDNSVWFTFIGPETGAITVDCPGFDNQIAVYDAASSADILSNDPANYTIIGASDDYYPENLFYAARIDNLVVEPGKQYWLQVDGSACGEEGEFEVTLTARSGSSVITNNDEKNKIEVYPNPAANKFFVRSAAAGTSNIQLLSINGQLIQNYGLIENLDTGMQFDLPEDVTPGVYLVKISENNNTHLIRLSVLR